MFGHCFRVCDILQLIQETPKNELLTMFFDNYKITSERLFAFDERSISP